MNDVIIKVGKSSRLRFRNLKCHRAITFDDIMELRDKYTPKIIIMDSIQSYELMDAVNTIKELTNEIVFIYDEGNNKHSQELAQIANTELATSLTGLQHSIAKELALSVITNWQELDNIDAINDLTYTINKTNKQVHTIIDKSDIGLIEEEINDEITDEILEEVSNDTVEELKELLNKVTEEKNSLASEVESKGTKISELMSIIDSLEEQKDIYKELLTEMESFEVKYNDDSKAELNEEISKLKTELDEKQKTIVNKNSLIDNILQEKNELSIQLQNWDIKKEQIDAKVEELESKNTEINTKLITFNAEKKNWEDRERGYTEQIKNGLNEIERLQAEIDDFEDKFKELKGKQCETDSLLEQLNESKQSNSEYLVQINNLSLEKSKLIQERKELEEKVQELNIQVQKIKFNTASVSNISSKEKEELDNKINELNKNLREYKDKLSSEHNARLINNMLLIESLGLIEEKDKQNENSSNEIDKLKSSLTELEEQVETHKSKYNEINKKYIIATQDIEDIQRESLSEQRELNNQISILTTEINKLRSKQELSIEDDKNNKNKIQELELQIMQLQSQIQSSTYSLEIAEGKQEELRLELEEKANRLKETQNSLIELQEELKAKEKEVSDMQLLTTQLSNQDNARYKTLEMSHKTLQVAMNKAVKELNDSKRQIVNLESLNRKLEASHNKLNQSFLNLCSGNAVSSKIELKCDYVSRANIIPVFGTGSYGITTTVMSIAKCIKDSRVLLMDMDLMGGKLDALVGKSPIIQTLPDIAQAFNKTALCSFIEKGYSYFEYNKDRAIQVLGQTPLRTQIDYFSGLCGKLNINQLLTADFTSLLNDVGRIYDYIIIDLGKIGSSDITDALIKMFIRVSKKALCVTLNDGATCRNANIKISIAGIDTSKIVWMLNLATTTAVDELTKKSIRNAEYIIMPQEMRIYNQHITLDKVQTLKSKVKELTDKLI